MTTEMFMTKHYCVISRPEHILRLYVAMDNALNTLIISHVMHEIVGVDRKGKEFT